MKNITKVYGTKNMIRYKEYDYGTKNVIKVWKM